MKKNFIHVCFIIDESGSMSSSVNDVIGGFERVVKEQKELKDGSCSVSLYKFNSNVEKVYIGKDVNDVTTPTYSPGGCTAMFDGIGTAIDEIGKWLSDMPEDERPEKNLIVIMTDGEENASKEYSASKIKEMIKEQEEKYCWSFVYLGTDITTTEYADSIGIRYQGYSSRKRMSGNYSFVSKIACGLRCSNDYDVDSNISAQLDSMTAEFKKETGKDIK